LINDFENIYKGNRIKNAFTDFDALNNFKPFESFLFILISSITCVFILSSIWGLLADKQFLKKNPHLKEFNIAKIMDEILNE
jgi:hypothetical protein